MESIFEGYVFSNFLDLKYDFLTWFFLLKFWLIFLISVDTNLNTPGYMVFRKMVYWYFSLKILASYKLQFSPVSFFFHIVLDSFIKKSDSCCSMGIFKLLAVNHKTRFTGWFWVMVNLRFFQFHFDETGQIWLTIYQKISTFWESMIFFFFTWIFLPQKISCGKLFATLNSDFWQFHTIFTFFSIFTFFLKLDHTFCQFHDFIFTFFCVKTRFFCLFL